MFSTRERTVSLKNVCMCEFDIFKNRKTRIDQRRRERITESKQELERENDVKSETIGMIR